MEKITESTNKQIGWKLKKEYKTSEKEIAHVHNTSYCFSTYKDGYNFLINSTTEKRYKELGTLEIWFEPVYEKNNQIHKLKHSEGELEIEFLKGEKILVEGEHTYINIYFLKNTLNECSIGRWRVAPETISIGCKKGIRMDEFIELTKKFEEFNKK